MRSISVLEYSLAFAVLGLEEAYLGLCLVCACYYPESFSRARHRLLRASFIVYPVMSALFISAFFITRQELNTHLPSFVLFCTWELINGLCLGAEIAYFWLSTFRFNGLWKFLTTCAGLLTTAVLVAGLWCSITTQRQWLWVFIPLLGGPLTLTGVCFTNDAAQNNARLRRHWAYFTLPTLLGLGLGLVAAFVPAKKAPSLQHVQYASQSMIGLWVVCLIQVLGVVSAHRSLTQANEASQAPRRDRSSPRQGLSRESLITEGVYEEIILGDLEGLFREGNREGPRKSEECEPRPDSLTLPGML